MSQPESPADLHAEFSRSIMLFHVVHGHVQRAGAAFMVAFESIQRTADLVAQSEAEIVRCAELLALRKTRETAPPRKS